MEVYKNIDVIVDGYQNYLNIESCKGTDITNSLWEALRVAKKIVPQPSDNNLELDNIILCLDDLISKEVDTILHNENFQELEAAWKSIYDLVKTAEDAGAMVSVMDISKSSLADDFSSTSNLRSSKLYSEIYELEYNMPGGIPYTVAIGNYYFDRSDEDVSLLDSISNVMQRSHCNFLSAISPSFFSIPDFKDIYKISDITEHLNQPEYYSWNEFRNKAHSKYINLTLPRFIKRELYSRYYASSKFNYIESVDIKAHCLWANTAFLLAENIIKSHGKHQTLSQILGPQSGGEVSVMTNPFMIANNFQSPTEVIVSETLEKQLSDNGLVCLSSYKDSRKACFFSVNSTQRVIFDSDDPEAINAKLNTQTSYILLMSRLAHHLKLIHREYLGSNVDKEKIQNQLNAWLSTWVTKMPNPSQELITKRPLKEAKIIVRDSESDPGNYHIDMYVVPHLKLAGLDIKLALVSSLPKEV